ncbi:hypothetical protein [Clostridium beijerinckii]|uniref:hypothetical protein n=1 Tax=Clostridium beijerinckii TaxID=1520 RepID=UPI00232C5107|nr:hypothetical protein [Clostridium beijerinckii]
MPMKKNKNGKKKVSPCSQDSILINTNNLDSRVNHKLNIIMTPRKRVIIKGFAYNAKMQPISGAAVEVIEVDYKENIRKVLGYTYTDNEGEYVLSIEALPEMFYEIVVYSPLNIKIKEI